MKYSNNKLLEYDIVLKKIIKNKFNITDSENISVGWGLKKSGLKAIQTLEEHLLLEDGFIRSFDLGMFSSPCHSLIVDNIGIYYDATKPSLLENLLNNCNKDYNDNLKNFILRKKISKYNNHIKINRKIIEKSVLFIGQTKGDSSLEYGMIEKTNDEILMEIVSSNVGKELYLKVHPDVLTGKKSSDIDLEKAMEYGFNIISDNNNPYDLFQYFDKIYTKTSQMGFEALIAGKSVYCFGMPFYAGWGLTHDYVQSRRRKNKLTLNQLINICLSEYPSYYDPYTYELTDIYSAVSNILKEKEFNKIKSKNLNFVGFSNWKRDTYLKYFKFKNYSFKHNVSFSKNIKGRGKNVIWGMKEPDVIECYRLEDGFIRSIQLGSAFTKPISLIIDNNGIYFNKDSNSNLIKYLNSKNNLNKSQLARAASLLSNLLDKKISKYNVSEHKDIIINPLELQNREISLVIGQVETDASIKYGAEEIKTNLSLIKKVKELYPNDYIIYKPHPDVLSGARGESDTNLIYSIANKVITDTSLDNLINISNKVHTITSLSGMEALMRNKPVYCYGKPFYSGWGLTKDYYHVKRERERDLLSLFYYAYIKYPFYFNNNKLTTPEFILEKIDIDFKKYHNVTKHKISHKIKNRIINLSYFIKKLLIGKL